MEMNTNEFKIQKILGLTDYYFVTAQLCYPKQPKKLTSVMVEAVNKNDAEQIAKDTIHKLFSKSLRKSRIKIMRVIKVNLSKKSGK